MAMVSVNGVCKSFGSFIALNDVSIDFGDGSLVTLLGPSGSGKTTLLRVIAGLTAPDQGEVRIDSEAIQDVPVNKRDVGMMFQNYALFPNMSVYDNVAFGLRARGISRAEIRQRVNETLELVELTGLDRRRPAQLSGGQRQRVALARAIVIKPRVLLLDEPLSALDKALRLQMQVELKRIQREVGVTTIMVTHDQEEALSLSDRIGLLNFGELVQAGTPHDVYEKPVSIFAARFLGDANILIGRRDHNLLALATGETIHFTSTEHRQYTNRAIQVAVRPEKMFLQSPDNAHEQQSDTPHTNQLIAVVEQHLFAGSSLTYLLRWGHDSEKRIDTDKGILKVFAQNAGETIFAIGERVVVTFAPAHTIEVVE